MSSLFRCWKDITSRKQQESELDEELRFHLEMQEKQNRNTGMTDQDAQRMAAIDLGGTEQIKEEVRSQRIGFWLETLFKDAAYGFRMLRKTPTLTAVSLITLALAIGACTALFSIFYGILLRPLPYETPEKIVTIQEVNPKKGVLQSGVNGRNLSDWRQRSTGFDGIAAYYTMGRTLTNGSKSDVILVSQVSSDFFHLFRTKPVLGRAFTTVETHNTKYNNALGVVSPDPVAILSNRLWVRNFGSDPEIIGKTVILDRLRWKVVGVMPSHFAMPDAGTELWIPWGLHHDFARDQHFAGAVARLRNNVTVAQAEGHLNGIAKQLESEFPETNTGWGVRLAPLQESLTTNLKELLWVLLAAVGLVLIIACVNVAILQLSKATVRVRESSVRMALGASRSRLIRQFLIESLILAIFGGALGVALAYAGIDWLRHLRPDLPRVTEVSIDHSVLAVSIIITALSALLFGLAPAFVGAGSKKDPALQITGVRTTSRASTLRLRNLLVAIEVALAVVLVASSGMLIRSFMKLRGVNPGFESRNVLVLPVFLDMEKYGSGEKSRGYYKRLMEDLKALPGVTSVGGATALPASPLGPDFDRPVWDQSSLAVEQNKRNADVRMVTPDYFRTLGISVRRGRAFTNQDGPDAPGVIIVNESLAKQIWQNDDPIGRQLVVDYSTAGTYPYEVVGVVNDVLFKGPRSVARPEIYLPHAQRPYLILNMAIRTTANPRLLISAVRDVMQKIDPQKPAHNITPLEDLVGATVARDRYAMTLVCFFAAVALLLALLGIYGVLAFFVRQRVQEIGIRMALGAQQNQIARWITRQGAQLMFAGLAAGLLAAIAFSRLLTGVLFEVTPLDAWSLFAAAFILGLTALIAAWIPARRASRIDPSIALRYE